MDTWADGITGIRFWHDSVLDRWALGPLGRFLAIGSMHVTSPYKEFTVVAPTEWQRASKMGKELLCD